MSREECLACPGRLVVFALSACGGADDERAYVLLEDVPDQVEEATVEGVTAVAEAAQQSEVSELRALGERLAQNLTRRQALERLSAGLFLEVVQADLDDLQRVPRPYACWRWTASESSA